jgi:O-antigen/teichoic acid export membrane protein
MSAIKQKATRGVVWAAVGSWGNQITSFVVFIALTRMLDPEAFGLVAMATVFTAFVGIFAEQGLGQAIVQREKLEPEHIDTAFWTNVVVGSGLTLFGVLVSGIVARIYKEPKLQPVIAALSFTLLITALSSTQRALLQRELDFRALSIRSLVAAIVGGIGGVVLALMGVGVYALVGKTLITGVVGTLILWRVSNWRPSLSYSKAHFRDLFSFGMNMVGVNMTNFVRTRLDDFLIGYFLGAEALGFYTVAYRLARLTLDMFTSVIGSVAVSTFARLQQNIDQLREAFYRVTRLASLITFPIFTGLILLAPELILGLSGEQWLPSIPIMRILSLAGFALTMQYFNSYLIISLGKPDRLLMINLASTTFTAIAFFIGARFGIIYVAIAYVVVNVSFFGVYLYVAHGMIRLNLKSYFTQLLGPAAACGFMAMGVYLMRQLFVAALVQNIISSLIISVLTGVVVYSVSIFLLRPSLLREACELIVAILPSNYSRFGQADF